MSDILGQIRNGLGKLDLPIGGTSISRDMVPALRIEAGW